MKRKIFTVKMVTICLMCLAFLLGGRGVFTVSARTLHLTWNASNSTGVDGYKVYYGPTSRGIGVDHSYANHVDVGNVTETEISIQEPGEHYSAVTAYRKFSNGDQESDYSNEVKYYFSAPVSPSSYEASSNFNVNDGYIQGSVDSVSNPKEVYWQKSGLSVRRGEEIELNMTAYCNNGERTPISIYVKDAGSGEWLTKERVVYLNYNFSGSIKMTIQKDCSNATLKVVAGHKKGFYEFSDVEIENYSNNIIPLKNVYLYRLVKSMVGGYYAAQFQWNEVPEADEFIVRVAKNRRAISNPDYSQLYKSIILSSNTTSFKLDVTDDLLKGFYVSVTPVVNGQEGVPIIYPYLPGNVVDDAEPPLYDQISVDRDDYYNAYYGYLYNWIVDAPNGAADERERMDIDNNDNAGRYDDFYFIKSQYGKSLE